MELVEEARLYHLLPDRRSDYGTTERCKPRKNAGTAQVKSYLFHLVAFL